ncbi:MAG TPA: extracellular solute-binding protein [Mesorhizobium sp.]
MQVKLKEMIAGGMLASVMMLTGAGGAAAQSNEVIMQDPGGQYGEALRSIMYDPFEKETGIKVVTVQEARSGPKIKAQGSGKALWDLTFIFDQETKLLGDCCLMDIDYSKLSESAQKTLATMPDNLKRKKGVALQVIGVAMAYNTEKYKTAPKDWADFWDVKTYPGKRCMPGWSRFVFEAALMADGVDKDKLYPIDMERALKKIAEIKPYVSKWWTTAAQAPQLMLDGEADMCMAYAGRINDLVVNEGAPVDMTWNQGFVYYDFFSIPKGAPNPENALKLLSYRLDAKRGAELSTAYPVPVPSPLVFQAADPKVSRLWANNPDNVKQAIQWSADYWGAPSPDGKSTNEEYAQEKLNALLAE